MVLIDYESKINSRRPEPCLVEDIFIRYKDNANF